MVYLSLMGNRDALYLDEQLPVVSNKIIFHFMDIKFICDIKIIFIRKIKGLKNGVINLVRACRWLILREDNI